MIVNGEHQQPGRRPGPSTVLGHDRCSPSRLDSEETIAAIPEGGGCSER